MARPRRGAPIDGQRSDRRRDEDRAAAYPKVLVAGRGFDQTSGAGITLTSLFSGWPKDRLAAACAAAETLDTTVCDTYYALGTDEVHWSWPLSRLERRVPSGPVPRGGADAASPGALEAAVPGPASGDLTHMGLARRAFWTVVNEGGGQHLLLRRGVSPRLAAWIRALRPDLVYTHLETLPMIGFVEDIVTLFDLPLVIHMMDDWPSVPEHEGLLGPVTRRLIDARLRRLMDRSSGLMGISRYMCDAFETRYGHRFLPFHNVQDATAWSVAPRSDWTTSDPCVLVYAGRVGKANEKALRDVAAVVAGLAASGLPVRLDIYVLERAPFAPGTWPDSEAIRVLPAVAYDHIPRLLVTADVLVLPLDFADRDLAYARYSMPTKVAEYLGSGTPILVYCPEDTAVTQYARQAGWAAVVGSRDADALARSIVRLATDGSERERLGRTALAVARADEDPARVRAAFADALREAAGRRAAVSGGAMR